MKVLNKTGKGLALAALLIPAIVMAGKPSTNADNVANDGYDVVAYFTEHAAVRGTKANSTTHNGATYYFSSKENLQSFRDEPDGYAPQFDGYCAFAVGQHGAKVKADPKTFKIRDGKLLLFFNDFHEGQPVNTIVFWNGSEPALSAAAEKNWKTLNAE